MPAGADERAQPHVVAFGALGFLDSALAHLDRERDRTHGERVGGVRAGTARGRDQPFGEIGQRGLVEERGHGTTPGVYNRAPINRGLRGRGNDSSSMSRIRCGDTSD